jgi:hypothetical protein
MTVDRLKVVSKHLLAYLTRRSGEHSSENYPNTMNLKRQRPAASGQNRALAVPNCSPLSCRSRVGELLPFTDRLVCKILISARFMA